MDVRLERIDPIRVVYFRGTGPYQTSLPPLWKRMHGYAQRRGLHRPGAWMLTVAHDNPMLTPPEQIRADACLSVGDDFVPDEDAAIQVIGGGLHAIYKYVGPYEGLGDAWRRFLGQWLPTSGYRLRGRPSFEVYRNSPADAPPAELVTELYEPVEPL